MRDKQSASRSPFLREEKALTPSLSPEKSFFLILPIALRLRLINRGGLTMYAPMDCQRLALKAPYRSTLKIRFYSFVALGRKAQGIEHDPPVIKYTPVAIRERNSALVGRSGRAHAGLWF